MKKLVRLTCSLILVAGILGACSGKKESTESASNDWKELDSFHMIMAESYHPLKDSANLAPAKANAELMAAEAEKWAAATLPEKVNNDEVKAMLEGLKANTRTFADKVRGGATDEELTAAMEALHDDFHHIHEAWQSGGSGEHH